MPLGPIEKLNKMDRDREKENRGYFNYHLSQSENYPHHDQENVFDKNRQK